ncbi:uncharacterized protein LOC126838006 isoform X2 [Adelges cooleyi]|uniref:uncharacterized protein LOC126838006 isoform X2 n=1 Tax=Adelges cooleyi TaxID=133065 RepID=UPI00217F9B4C|nr:uncharacterized protein LOC126838006 isoform X2 [Adelges cooleyi]
MCIKECAPCVTSSELDNNDNADGNLSEENNDSSDESKASLVTQKLAKEKILLVIDTSADPSMSNPSTLAVILQCFRQLSILKNRQIPDNQFAVCTINNYSYTNVSDFTTDTEALSRKLHSVNSLCQQPGNYCPYYKFDGLLDFVTRKYADNMTQKDEDYIFRVILTYNRDYCLPHINEISPITKSILRSPRFYFDFIHISAFEINNRTQLVFDQLAVLCNPWSYKLKAERNPLSIISTVCEFLMHPMARDTTII